MTDDESRAALEARRTAFRERNRRMAQDVPAGRGVTGPLVREILGRQLDAEESVRLEAARLELTGRASDGTEGWNAFEMGAWEYGSDSPLLCTRITLTPMRRGGNSCAG